MMTSELCNHDISMHSQHAMSAPSHLTRQHSGTHMSRHQPRAGLSRAELSRVEWSRAEPRAEVQDLV